MPIPHKDLNALTMMARHLRRRPHTVAELRKVMRVSERSVYRWLKYLEQDGEDVVSRRDKKNLVHFSIV